MLQCFCWFSGAFYKDIDLAGYFVLAMPDIYYKTYLQLGGFHCFSHFPVKSKFIAI